MGAVWELPAKQHSQSSPFSLKLGWIGCAIQQVTPKRLPRFLKIFRIYFFNNFSKNPQTTIALTFLTHIISGIGGVCKKRINLPTYSIDLALHGRNEPFLHGFRLRKKIQPRPSSFLSSNRRAIIRKYYRNSTFFQSFNQ